MWLTATDAGLAACTRTVRYRIGLQPCQHAALNRAFHSRNYISASSRMPGGEPMVEGCYAAIGHGSAAYCA